MTLFPFFARLGFLCRGNFKSTTFEFLIRSFPKILDGPESCSVSFLSSIHGDLNETIPFFISTRLSGSLEIDSSPNGPLVSYIVIAGFFSDSLIPLVFSCLTSLKGT